MRINPSSMVRVTQQNSVAFGRNMGRNRNTPTANRLIDLFTPSKAYTQYKANSRMNMQKAIEELEKPEETKEPDSNRMTVDFGAPRMIGIPSYYLSSCAPEELDENGFKWVKAEGAGAEFLSRLGGKTKISFDFESFDENNKQIAPIKEWKPATGTWAEGSASDYVVVSTPYDKESVLNLLKMLELDRTTSDDKKSVANLLKMYKLEKPVE